MTENRVSILQLPPGVQLDIVDTYFGLRKISLKNDANGRPRILLNNHFTFQVGFLDQVEGVFSKVPQQPSSSSFAWSLQGNKRKHPVARVTELSVL